MQRSLFSLSFFFLFFKSNEAKVMDTVIFRTGVTNVRLASFESFSHVDEVSLVLARLSWHFLHEDCSWRLLTKSHDTSVQVARQKRRSARRKAPQSSQQSAAELTAKRGRARRKTRQSSPQNAAKLARNSCYKRKQLGSLISLVEDTNANISV